MPKLSYLLIPGVIAVALFFIVSSFDSRETPPTASQTELADNFIAFSEGINTALFNARGNLSYTLQAERQIQFDDDTSELSKPLIRLINQNESQWNIVADSGRISAASEVENDETRTIALSGNVEVYSFDEFGNRIQVTTDYLELKPALEIAETDRFVNFQSTTITHSSTGMIANLGADEINFLSDSEGQYNIGND